jgi:starch synthase
MRLASAGDPASRVPTVVTIHNLAYQGLFDPSWMSPLDLPLALLSADALEYWGRISFLKGGINFADVITTVSPTYAREILTPDLGFGFDGILSARRDRLVGILNGIDAQQWDPARDEFLPAPFDRVDLSGKAEAKRAVLAAYGMPADELALARPLIGMISRMVDQKGLDLIAAAADRLLGLDAGFVVLGNGEPRYEEMWRRLAGHHPARVGARIGFDEQLAHLIEGGADIFLMPSRFEPCGLNQMYSLRYGTVPIVRATGGLHDTVKDYNERTRRGTGFSFVEYSPDALLAGVGRALDLFRRPAEWRRLQAAGMQQDFSWDASAGQYVKVYRRAVRERRR